MNTMPRIDVLPEIREYLTKKGQWPPPHRSEEPDHVYLNCFFCDSGRLTMHVETALWDCKTCGEKGNLISLKKRLGDTYGTRRQARPEEGIGMRRGGPQTGELPPKERIAKMAERLWDDEDAQPVRDYLINERKLPESVLRAYGVGCVRRRGKWWVAWVAFNESGDPAHVKFRTIPPAKREFRRWKNCPTILYYPPDTADALDQTKPLIVCEGEPDLLSLISLGFKNVITGTAGASQGWPDEWIRFAQEFPEVYLALDAGEAGERGARKLASAIGMGRCIRVLPPHGPKDWNEALMAGATAQTVQDCLDAGSTYKPDEIRRVSDFRMELMALRANPEIARGVSTGWQSLDGLLGGVRPGELTIVTGDTGVGKTTWVSALVWNLCRVHDWPILVAPFENGPLSIVKKWGSMEAGSDISDVVSTSQEQFDAAMNSLESLPLHLLDHWGKAEVEKVCDTIRWSAECEGVRAVILDHLHYMIGPSDQERTDIDETMRMLNQCCQETGVHIFLVTHPRNLERDQDHVQLQHLKGSSGIKQEAWNVFSVWRKRTKDRRREKGKRLLSIVTLLKVRDESGEEGRVAFEFDKGSSRYEEIPPDWDIRKEKRDESNEEEQGQTAWWDD